MKKRTISVVIPVYNEKDYLIPCLQALHDQELPLFEIIVVDNNTTDGSVAAAKKRFKNVRFLEEKRQGIVFARNTGFDAATGDIIAKLDCDTILYPGWHGNVLETIGNFDGWTGYVGNTELHPRMQAIANTLYQFFTYRVNSWIIGAPFMHGSNLAMSAKAWKQIHGTLLMRNDIWEDIDISLTMKLSGLDVVQSTFTGGTISARTANASPSQVYRRLMGMVRVYRIRKRWLSVGLSLVFVQLSFLLWLALKPLAFVGQDIKERPRPEQY